MRFKSCDTYNCVAGFNSRDAFNSTVGLNSPGGFDRFGNLKALTDLAVLTLDFAMLTLDLVALLEDSNVVKAFLAALKSRQSFFACLRIREKVLWLSYNPSKVFLPSLKSKGSFFGWLRIRCSHFASSESFSLDFGFEILKILKIQQNVGKSLWNPKTHFCRWLTCMICSKIVHNVLYHPIPIVVILEPL